ncbi:MAG: hypothetical protein VX367_12060, partial [SAR324 cluster bacterium]|nr:hypothetical protein [SAR324 cluster bacterium]
MKLVKVEADGGVETLRFSDNESSDEDVVVDGHAAEVFEVNHSGSSQDIFGGDTVDISKGDTVDISGENTVDISGGDTVDIDGKSVDEETNVEVDTAAEAVRGLTAEEEKRKGKGKGKGGKEKEGKSDEKGEEDVGEEERGGKEVGEEEVQEEEAGEVEVVEEYTAEQMEQKASEESQALVGLEEEETRRKREEKEESPLFSQLDFDPNTLEVFQGSQVDSQKKRMTKEELMEMSQNASEIEGMSSGKALEYLNEKASQKSSNGSVLGYIADLDCVNNTLVGIQGVVGNDDGGFKLSLMPPMSSSDLAKKSKSSQESVSVDSQVTSSSDVQMITQVEQSNGKRVREEGSRQEKVAKKNKNWKITEVYGLSISPTSPMEKLELPPPYKPVLLAPSSNTSTVTSSSSLTKPSTDGSLSTKPSSSSSSMSSSSSSSSSSSKKPLFRPQGSSSSNLAFVQEPDFMADIPMIQGRKELTTILPDSSVLRDPMKNITNKENVVPSTSSAAKKQATLTKHVKHTFSQIPKVKKSTAILGNYRSRIPSRLRHRCCAVCLKIFQNNTSRNAYSLHAHIQNSHCPFIKANVTNQIGSSRRCFICFELFDDHKHINDDIIQHFSDYNHPVRCPHCSIVVNFNSLFDHMVKETYEMFRDGINCVRCRMAFYDASQFYNHLNQKHDIRKPNWAHFNRYIGN